jgi:hypothetical protein
MMKNSTGTMVSIGLFLLGGALTAMIVDPDQTPAGVMILLWAFFSLTPAILFNIFVDKRSQNRSTGISEAADSYIKQNHLSITDNNQVFSLKTSHSCILVIPVTDEAGKKYLTVWDGVNNLRYTLPKGSIIRYRVNVNGQQISAIGGSFLGFGMIKGNVEAISSVNVVVILNNGNYSDICIGRNIVRNEFDETNRFLNRFESTLEMFR